ncbi:helix-turn-helix transcriptional regulator [[Curtobacterium] plantarum]|uniref:helix-turn-helix transcriptional regulator n=1 Tax=[Curtobacterium] plantarum TaxID=221276 RepID=UPI000F079BA5|nr:LuxR C-terminal-related transcriptional regulator [[Curtobacterium] plantarum]RNA72345.1 helix-turn-helix transcriptional regulator [[Curtobacterium] plantarum]
MNDTNCSLIFSENEMVVTWFFMTGMTTKKIAEWTSLSEKSVNYLKKSVMKKVGAKNSNELIIWLLNNNQTFSYKRSGSSKLHRYIAVSENG